MTNDQMEQMNDDIDNKTYDTNDDQITNTGSSQILQTTRKNLQSNVFMNLPLMKILIHL